MEEVQIVPIVLKCVCPCTRERERELWTWNKAYTFQFRGSVHHTMIIEHTSLMQQDTYIFHLYVFSTCFGPDITHHQELQNCTYSDMVMVPREVRRDVVEGRQHRGCIIPQTVTHSLVLLKMGKIIFLNMFS
jgi:hypothetical protein